jgi:antitoxin component YwqK of YwqJK toxin-antitoxin module
MLRISIPPKCGEKTIPVFSLVLISLFLISCSREIKVKKELSMKNGIIYETKNKKLFTGTISDTVSNQILTYEVVEGTKNGQFKVTSLTGKTLMSGNIKDNKNEGKWKYYYPNGKLESEGTFREDVPEDKWIWYYEDGTIKEEGVYKQGKREGIWIMYDQKGNVKSYVTFKGGEKISELNKKNYWTT